MQELVIVTSCDIDFNDSLAKVEAVPVPWHLDGVPWVIDMCKEHRDTVSVSQMDDLVRMYGCPAEERGGEETKGKRKTAAKKSDEPEAERVPCPYPDCGTDYKNRGSLSGHFNERHGVTLATWEAEQLPPQVPHGPGHDWPQDPAPRLAQGDGGVNER
jgi:hypothetical protein